MRAALEYGDLKALPGWLAWTDYRIFTDIIEVQNDIADTGLVEIGVHQGKSFIPMALLSKARKLYAIDLFGNQALNIDHSGKGDLAAFKRHLAKFGIDEDRVVIDPRLSSDVTADDVLSKVGKVGFFHIDGAHHFEAVAADIDLAVAVASPECVIVLDDMFRPEWPDVSIAAFGSQALKENRFEIFAVGFNKGYFCRSEFTATYQAKLRADVDLSRHLRKAYGVSDRTVLVYQRYPLPEWGPVRFVHWYLSVWYPRLFNRLARPRPA